MSSRWRQFVPSQSPVVPADLGAVVALVVVFVAVTVGAEYLPVLNETPLRVAVGFTFVLFVPGYALTAALFPETATGSGDAATDRERDATGINGIERAALSIGTSVVVVPSIGYVLNFTPWGIRLIPVVTAVSGFTLAAAAAGTVRRNELPPDERFTVPYRQWVATARSTLFEPVSRTDAALNVVLAVSLLLAAGSVGYAVAVPKENERFTELYLLTDSGDGDLVADDYPRNFTVGEPRSLYVGVENHEHRTVRYTVVVSIQNVTFENNESRVLEAERLRTFRTTLAHGETWQSNHSIAPTLTGDRLRLTYFLYRGQPPATPTVETADREVHLWVNVSASPTPG